MCRTPSRSSFVLEKVSRRLSPGVGFATAIVHQSTCVFSQAQHSLSENRSLCNRNRALVNEQDFDEQVGERHDNSFVICHREDGRTWRTQRTGWMQTALGGAESLVIT